MKEYLRRQIQAQRSFMLCHALISLFFASLGILTHPIAGAIGIPSLIFALVVAPQHYRDIRSLIRLTPTHSRPQRHIKL